MPGEQEFTGEFPGSGAGNQADQATDDTSQEDQTDDVFSDDTETKGKRSTDQVRGELLRKLGDMEKRYEKQLKQMQDAIPNLLSTALDSFVTKNQTQAQSNANTRKTLSEYSLDELEAGRAAVLRSNDPALKDEYDAVLARKRGEKAAEDVLNRRFQQDETTKLDARTKKLIADTYGSMGIFEEGSEFRNRFNQKLQELERLGIRSGPAMLGAATEAALELGLHDKPLPRRNTGGNAASGRTNAPTDDSASDSERAAELNRAIDEFERNTGRKFDAKARKDMLSDYKKIYSMKSYIVKGSGF